MWSDHKPTEVDLQYSLSAPVTGENQLTKTMSYTDWHDKNVIRTYYDRTNEALDGVYSNAAVQCDNTNCSDESHLRLIDNMYRDMTNCLKLSEPSKRKRTYNHVAGWNDYVKELNDAARESFLLWVDSGKPRQGPIHRLMKDCVKLNSNMLLGNVNMMKRH